VFLFIEKDDDFSNRHPCCADTARQANLPRHPQTSVPANSAVATTLKQPTSYGSAQQGWAARKGLVGGPPGQRGTQHYMPRYPRGVMMRHFKLFPISSEDVLTGKVMHRGKVRRLHTPKVVRTKERIGKAKEVGLVTKSLIKELFGD